MGKCCANCKYWKKKNSDIGYCKRYTTYTKWIMRTSPYSICKTGYERLNETKEVDNGNGNGNV